MIRLFFIIILSTLLSACGLTRPAKIPVQSKYTLSKPSTAVIARRSHATLLINRPIASSGYERSDMIYVLNNRTQLKSFANNRWVAPPAQLLQPLLVQSFANSGLFRAVVASPFGGRTTYRIDTHLLKLQQQFSGDNSQVMMTVQVTLVKNSSNTIIASRRFTTTAKAPQNNPYGGVIAANVATKRLLTQVVRYVGNQT